MSEVAPLPLLPLEDMPAAEQHTPDMPMEEMPGLGETGGVIPSEAATNPYHFTLEGALLLPDPEMPSQIFHEAIAGNYDALQQRIITNPEPTAQELHMGAFVEEIQPQARDAVLLMRQKGYDMGNVLHVGFMQDNHDRQGMTLHTALSRQEIAVLERGGFVVENGVVSFQPEAEADLEGIKNTWDLLADILPDKGEIVGPAMFSNALNFRRAAENGTLLDFYLPNGKLDMVGTKYVRDRDPNRDHELFLSPEAAVATRELTFIDQHLGLKNRLTHNPAPTAAELNMGVYKEELEPQVRDAVMAMRLKGYNTGSSGFWGEGHLDQVMDIATPFDRNTVARLAEHNIEVTTTGIRFRPDDPSNLESIKRTWDLVADILPDLGRHADPATSERADVFRYITQQGRYEDLLENWIWQTGALNGHMPSLAMMLVREGRDFGPDVHAAGRIAEARYQEMVIQAYRKKVDEALQQ